MNLYCNKIIRFIIELRNNNNRYKLINYKKYSYKNVKILIKTKNK